MRNSNQLMAPTFGSRQKSRRLAPGFDLGFKPNLFTPEEPIDSGGGRFSVISKLESRVSLIQVAISHINRLSTAIREVRDFLDRSGQRTSADNLPYSIINSFITDRIGKLEHMVEAATFKGRRLLNGDCGVVGTSSTDRLRFVRGGPKVVGTSFPGYPVTIYQAPQPASLVGAEEINPAVLQKERVISIVDGSHSLRYHLNHDESPDSFIRNLQEQLIQSGINLKVGRTEDNRLQLFHNDLGSEPFFYGMSQNTRLISTTPGEFLRSMPGRDISGTIGLERADGFGGYLVGSIGNSRTEGLAVYFDGTVAFPGEVVGYMQVKQNGISVPCDFTGETHELLTITSLMPQALGVGISNQSGYQNLGEIKGNSFDEVVDSLKMIEWALGDLEHLVTELRTKESDIVCRTIEILRESTLPRMAGEDLLLRSKDQASSMAEELKTLLTGVAS